MIAVYKQRLMHLQHERNKKSSQINGFDVDIDLCCKMSFGSTTNIKKKYFPVQICLFA
jgi:hypothetical protein